MEAHPIPESLCARLLKAKYFPRGCLIDTSFSTNASYTWQSITHVLELVKQGIYLAGGFRLADTDLA
jgi:hypothetical protein